MREVILESLRCPASGAPLHREGDELVDHGGKHRYPLHAGRIPLFAELPDSRDAARQQRHYDQLAPLYYVRDSDDLRAKYEQALAWFQRAADEVDL